MTVLNLVITNTSAVGKQFFIFADKPNASVSQDAIFTNVFLTDYVPSTNSSTFTWVRDMYAVVGKQTLQNGATVSQVGYQGPVTLGTDHSKGSSYRMKVNRDSPSIAAEASGDSGKPGAYNILTGTDFNQGDPYWLGLGNRTDDSSPVVPVATIQCTPNADTNIYPHLDYYIATGDLKKGEIFDAQTIGASFKVSYDGGKDTASVQYLPNGTFKSG
jgi:hypothetical protein